MSVEMATPAMVAVIRNRSRSLEMIHIVFLSPRAKAMAVSLERIVDEL